MPQTTLIIDDATAKIIEELKQSFGTKTAAAAIRRALVFARVAAQNAADDDTVTLIDKHNVRKQIMLKA